MDLLNLLILLTRHTHFLGLWITAALMLGIVAGAGQAEAQTVSPGSEPSFRTNKEEDFAKGRLLVKLEEDTPRQVLDNVNRRNDAHVEERLSRIGVDVIDLPPGLSVSEAEKRYESYLGVEYAEPDFQLLPAQISANDPEYPKLYGLENTGQTGGTADADIDAPEAWSRTTGSSSTVVAVIDTGVDISHPDLKDNIWTNPDEVVGNGVDDDKNGYVDDLHGWNFCGENARVYDPNDGDEHGTHVAGTIAAEGNNGIGVSGINWQAKILPLKFICPKPDGYVYGYYSDAIEAINYAIKEGASISNNSWGGGGKSQALQDAISQADAAGHLFVAAAGNGGSDGVGDDNDATPFYPASYNNDNVVSVAATDKDDALASFSNYGDATVDLGAPGARILSTLPGNTYGAYTGTSMATPHVAGVAALIKSQSPSLTDTEIKAQVLKTAEKKSSLTGKTVTGGRLDAAQALGINLTDLSLSANPLSVLYGNATALSGTLSASGDSFSGRTVLLEKRPVGASGFSPVSEVTTASDGTFKLTGVKPDRNTDYRARFEGSATEGLEPSTSSAKRVNVRVKVAINVSDKDLKLGRSRTISGAVSPSHTGSVKVVIKRNGEKIATKSVSLNDSRYKLTYKPPRPGRYAFFTVFQKDTDHLGNRSPQKTFKVVR
jgi:thermitase